MSAKLLDNRIKKKKIFLFLLKFIPIITIVYKIYKINFPNILHEFRRLYINLSMSKQNKVEKSYIKKMLVLIKTILRGVYSEFSYGYLQTLNLLYEIMEKEGYSLINNSHFDIIEAINNIGNSKEQILKFSEILLGFAEINIEKEGVKVYEKKN